MVIPFFYKGCKEKCILAVASTVNADLHEVLSPCELRSFNSFSSEKRKLHYALGRIVSKKAVQYFDGRLVANTINIINAENGCPFIENSEYSVSISHSENIAASLAFKKELSFGIDIEFVRPNRKKALSLLATPSELIKDDERSLTVAWTLKEAISKALKCGFNVSFENFEISKLNQKNKIFECGFSKYPEYCGKAVLCGDIAFAIVCKKEYELSIDFEKIKSLLEERKQVAI